MQVAGAIPVGAAPFEGELVEQVLGRIWDGPGQLTVDLLAPAEQAGQVGVGDDLAVAALVVQAQLPQLLLQLGGPHLDLDGVEANLGDPALYLQGHTFQVVCN